MLNAKKILVSEEVFRDYEDIANSKKALRDYERELDIVFEKLNKN